MNFKPEWCDPQLESGIDALEASGDDRPVAVSYSDDLILVVVWRDREAYDKTQPAIDELFRGL